MSGVPWRLDPCWSRTGQRPAAAYIVRAVRSGAVHCVIGIYRVVRGRSAWPWSTVLPQLLGQVVGAFWTSRCFAAELTAGRGGLMIRAESPARKKHPAGRHAVLPRATWAPMLNPSTLRSVPRIWGRSLTSTPRAGRPQYESSTDDDPLVRRCSSLLRSTRAWNRRSRY
jgi:hypothetical protein